MYPSMGILRFECELQPEGVSHYGYGVNADIEAAGLHSAHLTLVDAAGVGQRPDGDALLLAGCSELLPYPFARRPPRV